MKKRWNTGSVAWFGVMAMIVAVFAPVAWSQESKTAASQETQPATTQAAMRGIFQVLSKVYGYSFDATAYADPKNREEIGNWLVALAKNADELQQHGGGLDPSFDFARRSIQRDAHDALTEFQNHNDIGSRYILNRITDNCVTCHTKLPSNRNFALGKEFLESIDVSKMPPTVRANLQIAARQFPDAITTYEGMLSSPKVTAQDLETYDVFEKFFRVSVGPMNDTKHAIETLKKFGARSDLPAAQKADVQAWIASLETLNLNTPVGEDLATARRMVTDARAKTTGPSDHSRMVEFIGSITLLHRYLRTNPQNNNDVAEAYYLLGVSESYVSHSFWISETDYLLEKSIRTAPKSDIAKQALAFLEAYRKSGYNVAPARPVPPGMQTNIDELRKLTQQ
jgi:hypothetical protein